MAGLRQLQRGVYAFTLAILLVIQLGPAPTAFNSGIPGVDLSRMGGVIPMVECNGDTCG